MPPPLDPYRTLGLSPGASADEIRRAYRRLAKANHPDSAGEAALPRFLAIQAAYEMLIEGRTRRSTTGGMGGASARGTAGRAGEGPWQADPGRARATRNAYARRQRAGQATGDSAGEPATGASGSSGRSRPSGPSPDPGASTGHGPRTSGARDRSRRSGGRTREPNKATLGSTSYDAAEDEPFEPDWSGGTWYGASSGTYWTINPKEYADPRKHGPEYQRRARRVIDGVDVDPSDGPSIEGDDLGGPESETATGERRPGFDGRRTYPDATAEPDPDAESPAGPPRGQAPADAWVPPAHVAQRETPAELAGRLLDGRVALPGRLLLTVLGWAPIGAVIAWLSGELSGCGRFTASCIDPEGSWLLFPHVVVIVVLAAMPWLAAISAAGTVGLLVAAVPAAFVLSAGGGARQPEASGAVLIVVGAAGYAGGVVLATARRLGWRRVP
jgi:curved DNA-binding protein CbpA